MAKYQNPSTWKAIGQAANSFIPFFLIWYLMYLSLAYSYWLTLILALPAAGFVVRMFIIQHDHHLSPRIPNYLLEKCHEENPALQQVVVLTLWSSLKTISLSLWDEEQGQLVSFRQLKPIGQMKRGNKTNEQKSS